MIIHVHALSTAVPPYRLEQELVALKAQEILGPKYLQFERLLKTLRTAGVETRYSAAPIAWFNDNHGWSERNVRYRQAATALFIAAAQDAFARAGWRAVACFQGARNRLAVSVLRWYVVTVN